MKREKRKKKKTDRFYVSLLLIPSSGRIECSQRSTVEVMQTGTAGCRGLFSVKTVFSRSPLVFPTLSFSSSCFSLTFRGIPYSTPSLSDSFYLDDLAVTNPKKLSFGAKLTLLTITGDHS